MASDPSLVDMENENRDRLKFESAQDDVTPEPKRGRGRPRKTETIAEAPTVGPQYKAGVIRNGFEDLYATIGTVWSMVDPVCGPALIQCAPKSAEVLEEMAKTNPQVRKILLKFLGTSAIGKLFAAHTPLIMAVFMHHGMGRMQQKEEEKVKVREEHRYQGFQPDLFNQESPGMGVPTMEDEWSHFGEDSIPNSGHGFTYQMPANPALSVG